MRTTSTTLLLAASSYLVQANWLRWSGDSDLSWTPQETGATPAEDGNGWTPKPTPGPGSLSEQDAALELFKREGTTWVNSNTCGWFSGVSSSAWTCTNSSTCATNYDNVVACASGTYSPFYSVCFDYAAYEAGACKSIGALTGCCQNSQYKACGTYIWTGSPPRSMYRCFSSATIISMLDEPQFVIDASLSSKSSTVSSSTNSGQVTSSSADVPTSIPSSGSGGDNGNGGGSSTNVGAIVGGVVGGVGGLALIAGIAAFFIIRRKRRSRETQTYGPVPPNDGRGGAATPAAGSVHPQHPGMGSPQMSQTGYYPQSEGATTFPPNSPYAAQGQHDPRHSMVKPYDPNAPAQYQSDYTQYNGTQQQQQQYPGGLHPGAAHSQAGTSPPHSPGQPGYINPQATGSSGTAYNPHHSVMSAELESHPPSGHQQNPVEVGTENYR